MAITPTISHLVAARDATPPAPPKGLGVAGRAEWKASGAYARVPGRRPLACDVARAADQLAVLDKLASEAPVVPGSSGQARVNGALSEARALRSSLAQLRHQLRT